MHHTLDEAVVCIHGKSQDLHAGHFGEDLAGRFDAVHDRHSHIHENDIRLQLAGQFDGPALNMLEINYAPLVGGTVITKKAWDGICPDARQALLAAAADAGRDMTAKSRQESDDAVTAMQKRGLKVHGMTPADNTEWTKLADEVKPQVRGALVPEDMFDKVQQLLVEYRSLSAGGRK